MKSPNFLQKYFLIKKNSLANKSTVFNDKICFVCKKVIIVINRAWYIPNSHFPCSDVRTSGDIKNLFT